MLLSKEVNIKWVANNVKYYVEKGYEYSKTGKEFTVKIEDLNPNSKYMVSVKCDYCTKDFEKQYKMYHRDRDVSPIKKDACKDCAKLKRKESMLLTYGKEHALQVDKFKDKYKETLMENHGVDNPLKSEEIKNKAKNTIINKFGVEYVTQSKEIMDKVIATNIERYGAKTNLCFEDVREKGKDKIFEKYGVNSVFKLDEFRQKSMWALYENGTAPCSKQQKYVNDVVGGDLNFPVNKLFLDIAFPKEFIYVECDFRGHDLHVRLGNITQEDMDNNEMKRYYMLRDLGWKMVRIISVKDRVPSKEKLLEMIDIAKSELKNHSWIKFDLDNGYIETSNGFIKFEFGDLTRFIT